MSETKKVRQESLRARLAARYGNAAEWGRGEMLEIQGDHRATVYGCRRILLYSPEEIRLCVGKKTVSVIGHGLFCASFCAGAVTVCGRVSGVLFSEPPQKGGR